jgi:hypothetical protein
MLTAANSQWYQPAKCCCVPVFLCSSSSAWDTAERTPLNGLLYQPYILMCDDDCGPIRGINEWQGKLKCSEETCLSSAVSTANRNDSNRARTRAAAMGYGTAA